MPLPCAQWIHSHTVRGLCTYKVHYLQVMFVDMAQSTSDHIFVLVIFNQFLKHHFGSADLHISGGYDDHDWSLGRYDTGPRSWAKTCPLSGVWCLHPGSVSRWQPHSSPWLLRIICIIIVIVISRDINNLISSLPGRTGRQTNGTESGSWHSRHNLSISFFCSQKCPLYPHPTTLLHHDYQDENIKDNFT